MIVGPQIQFSGEITLGNLVTVGAFLGIGWRALRVLRRMDRLFMEHDMMWREYAREHRISHLTQEVN